MEPIGAVMQLQNFSVNDGDGIRTTVFLAGCPLCCRWCCNPEGLDRRPKVAYHKALCTGCVRCMAVCPQGIGVDLNAPDQRTRCTGCGACAAVCPTGARKAMVTSLTVEELVRRIQPQLPFLRDSGGGVTFSGGEATQQADFLHAAATRLYDMGLHLALETCGLFDFAALEPTLRLFQLIFLDVKHVDSDLHRRFTGQPNDAILKNLPLLSTVPAEVVVRVPVIATVNADEETLRRTARTVKAQLPKARMELLPYHRFGEEKYEALGLPLPDEAFTTPSEATLARLRSIVESEGVCIASYR